MVQGGEGEKSVEEGQKKGEKQFQKGLLGGTSACPE